MQSQTWARVSAILAEALERPPGERRAFLDEVCANKPAVRLEVEALLAFNTEVVDTDRRQAILWLQKAVAIQHRHLGEDHPSTVQSVQLLAR